MSKVFTGRRAELRQLNELLEDVRAGGDRPGRALLVRGRRRVGKSRLIEVFCERAHVPWLFYAATLGEAAQQQREELFRSIATESTMPMRELAAGATPTTWDAAFRQIASLIPVDAPSIVVLDELPYLGAADPAFEGAMQTAWDRHLAKLPVLFIGVGSDLAMMELLSSYGRPFHQRAREMVLDPLSPAEVGKMVGLQAAEAFDAYLVSGGLPLICRDWQEGASLDDFLTYSFGNPTSPLLVSGERSLAAELPPAANVTQVFNAIGGAGERTFTTISQRTGLNAASLSRSLELLLAKRLIAVDTPLSTKVSNEKHYRVADPYLRFWLAIAADAISRVDRGRGDLAMRLFKQRWSSWRGRAVEPVIRQALERLLPDEHWPEVDAIGSWWPRCQTPEIDLVGTDGNPARIIHFIGSIKWRDKEPFTGGDLSALARDAASVPGVNLQTKLVAVSRAGGAAKLDGLATLWTPEDLLGYGK